jgi:hypothetical protein
VVLLESWCFGPKWLLQSESKMSADNSAPEFPYASGWDEPGTTDCPVCSNIWLPSARNVQRISKFLRVVSDASMPDERGVMSNDNKLIAVIGYYKPWREWVLYPEPKTVWSTDCLDAMKRYLADMGRLTAEDGPNLTVLAD